MAPDLVEGPGNVPVTVIHGMLVDQGGSRAGMPQLSHHFLGRAASLGGQGRAHVPKVVKMDGAGDASFGPWSCSLATNRGTRPAHNLQPRCLASAFVVNSRGGGYSAPLTGCAHQVVTRNVVAALVAEDLPVALTPWVPGPPEVEGALAVQEKVPSPAAVVAHSLTEAGDARPVWYLTVTGSPAEKPPPVMVRGVPAVLDRAR